MQEALATYRATGARLFLPFFLACLAEGHVQVGGIQDGLQVVTEALQLNETDLAGFWEAELERLKGELTLAQSSVQSLASPVKRSPRSKVQGPKSKVSNPQSTTHNPQLEMEAEGYFLKAIDIARSQGAKSLELRAVMSLGRLWHHQGKSAEARQKLTELYGWFTEGFDTKDLQEAKALLEKFT